MNGINHVTRRSHNASDGGGIADIFYDKGYAAGLAAARMEQAR